MCVSAFFPVSMINELDGLVIAGMGTGSLSDELIDTLTPFTSKIPIVISTRCQTGMNVDDFYYLGSLQKYEKKGFKITGYEQLTPLQARIKLILQISQKNSKT
jgi:L-asparaginase